MSPASILQRPNYQYDYVVNAVVPSEKDLESTIECIDLISKQFGLFF